MSLNQQDRLTISQKLVDIPQENSSIDLIKDQLNANKQVSKNKDDSNKNLQDKKTTVINPYQLELSNFDGNERTEITEQDMSDSADKILQNPFYPNDVQNPTPSLADGVWKQFIPFSRGKGIGKDYFEVYPSIITKEQDKIDAINTAITNIELLSDGIRSSGQECTQDTTGVCTGGVPLGATDESTCLLNGGVWTPNNGPDIYSPSTAAITALSDFQTAIDDWKSFVQSTKIINQDIATIDTDSTRLSENTEAISDIDNLISIIDAWNLHQDFDTTTILPSGNAGTACAAFDALSSGYFDPSKLRSPEMQFIKDEIAARELFITTRISQIEGYLGTVVQDTNDGSLTTTTGLYGDRFKIVDLRLNLMGGTLNSLKGVERGIGAQNQLQLSNDNANSVYSGIMSLTTFRQPAAGTNIIHVMDGSIFSVGDTVYVAANKQSELTGTIESISGDMLTLSFVVSKKYRQNEKARIYKIL